MAFGKATAPPTEGGEGNGAGGECCSRLPLRNAPETPLVPSPVPDHLLTLFQADAVLMVMVLGLPSGTQGWKGEFFSESVAAAH